jgi:UDP-hydrolysing UDP-N-acetyl-D-glucosamine 2-epimerase
MSRRKVCIVTGTRAEYGLLHLLMKEIANDTELELQIVATGMHLSPEFGLTYQIIEDDGFEINEKVEMLLSGDTPVAITKSIGLATIGFADAFERLKPDLLVVLGDRYEMLAAAQSAMVARIPIAHIAGGDTTEGAIDEAIRHSITKMSHLHFVTNDISAQRVLQMGENPKHVYNVGSPGIDQIKCIDLIAKEKLEEALGFRFREKNVLVTFHPVTLDSQPAPDQFEELLRALDRLGDEVGIIITKPNSDTNGRALIQMIDDYVNKRSNAKSYTSLGQLKYLSTMAVVDAVVGNSSSGLYEAPSFKKPTVNIGDRQKGRLLASSIINCEPIAKDIESAIQKAFELDCSNTMNPYGNGDSVPQMISIIKNIKDYYVLLKKHFYKVGL